MRRVEPLSGVGQIGQFVRVLLSMGLLGAFATACNCGPAPSGLRITVGLESSSAKCVVAGVELEGSGRIFRNMPPLSRGTKGALLFGIQRTDTIKGKVIPLARGYRSGDCSGVGFDMFDESAVGSVVDLDKAGVQLVTLALRSAAPGDGGLGDAGLDDGGLDGGALDGGGLDGGALDGGALDGGALDGGALDGGALDAGCVPAAAENCLDGQDNTCDGLIDCADPTCNALACTGGGTCTLQTDGGSTCVQPIETLCADLSDNDGDGKIDCADPDCAGKTCDDSNACTSADVCSPFAIPDGGGFCDGGAPLTCTNGLLNCRSSAGVCIPATGACSFSALDAGQACNDSVPCTYSDRCNAAAVCAGTTYACATSQCVDAGTCMGDGGCAFVYSPPTTACDDLATCTHTDNCNGAGICSGTGYSCSPSPACFSGTACLGDGGCARSFNGAGTTCPSGTCGADAGCITNVFTYTPSNFDPTSIPDASIAAATVFTACTVEFDSTTNTFTDGGWCNQPKPTPFVFNQLGTISTTVLAMQTLVVAADATLIIHGSRPVILAVYGTATIQGVIDARSVDTTRVGPGGNFFGCALQNGGNALLSAGGGGAGFGTAGKPGAGAGAGLAGIAGISATLQPLRGGCRGGNGHDSSNRLAGIGGSGGGALQISSAASLVVTGTVSASGAGGLGGANGLADDSGAAGGGSGGALLLEGNLLALTSTARLVCNGGAGGGGRQNGSGVEGQAGQSGSLDTPVIALGGQGGTPPAGDGGSGAAGATAAGNAVAGSGTAGSGGGGAGLGVIRLNAATSCAIADAGIVLSGSLSKSALCP